MSGCHVKIAGIPEWYITNKLIFDSRNQYVLVTQNLECSKMSALVFKRFGDHDLPVCTRILRSHDKILFSTFLQIGISEFSNIWQYKVSLGNTYKLAISIFLGKFLIPSNPP